MKQAAPTATFRTVSTSTGTHYGWKCDAHNILAYGNTASQAEAEWLVAYREEYGHAFQVSSPVTTQVQEELFA
jgi:hypothetical protein